MDISGPYIQKFLNFWAEIDLFGPILATKSIVLISFIFFNHCHQDLDFAHFAPVVGHPCGPPMWHPPYHLPYQLHTCFLCPMSPKKMFSYENLTAIVIFKLVGGMSIFAHFGHFWPTLNHPGVPWRMPSSPVMVFPCYTYLIPCPNI